MDCVQHYSDLADIRRVMANTHAIQPEALKEFFGDRLSAEWALACLEDLVQNPQNLNLVVDIAVEYTDAMGGWEKVCCLCFFFSVVLGVFFVSVAPPRTRLRPPDASGRESCPWHGILVAMLSVQRGRRRRVQCVVALCFFFVQAACRHQPTHTHVSTARVCVASQLRVSVAVLLELTELAKPVERPCLCRNTHTSHQSVPLPAAAVLGAAPSVWLEEKHHQMLLR